MEFLLKARFRLVSWFVVTSTYFGHTVVACGLLVDFLFEARSALILDVICDFDSL